MIKKEECNYLDVARFIGIYLVILGHFPFNESNVFFEKLIYAFHMPLFFFISGYLHKDTMFSLPILKKILYSLIVPYIIYNVVFIVPHFIRYDFSIIVEDLKNICLVRFPANIPTWFFVSLFWVKVFSMFCKSKQMYIIISLLCVVALYINNFFPYPETFGIKAAFAAFPFFVIGFLLKDKPFKLIKPKYSTFIFIIVLFLLIVFVNKYGYVNMYLGIFKSIVFYFAIGAIVSIAIVYLSNFLPLKNNIIKTVSRGTMLIVGTHWIIIVFFTHFTPNLNFVFSVVISLIITLLYYFPIYFTYRKFPILYGKTKSK